MQVAERLKELIVKAPPNSFASVFAKELERDIDTLNLHGKPVSPGILNGMEWLEKIVGISRPEKFERLSDLLIEPVSDIQWMIEGLWTANSRGFIAGHPGVGKTWLALDLMLSVCMGLPVFGKYPVPRPLNVLLVEEESSRESLKRRMSLLARGHGFSASDLADRFFVQVRQFFKITKDRDELSQFIASHKIGLVVFDSLRRIHDAKESSSDEMSLVMESLAHLQADTGVSIMLIHHLKKAGTDRSGPSGSIWEQLRGSSDLWAWRDCIIGMETTDDPSSATCQFQFRDAEAGPPILISRHEDLETSAIVLRAEAQSEWGEFKETADQILALLSSSFEPLSANKIQSKLKIKRKEILDSLRWLLKSGKVEKVGSGSNTKWVSLLVPGTDGNRGNR